MKKGFTTGSCAAAAASAAATILLGGRDVNKVNIVTPAGIVYKADIVNIIKTRGSVSCAVVKDAGDDPDVTNGAKIVATVSYYDGCANESDKVYLCAGKGVGIVTKPGLDQQVGNAAINSVPRKMITAEVIRAMELFDYEGVIKVEISVPDGEMIAKNTFNPRLGIEGGISIIGTSGIVEPMSKKALLDTIQVELRQKFELGNKIAIIAPGNYGRDFLKRHYDYDIDSCVKCSNFIGDTIDMAIDTGFEKLLLIGHIGKLIKVSGGIMNTHSKVADCRMELLLSALVRAGVNDTELFNKVLNCVTTDEAIRVIDDTNLLNKTMNQVIDKIMYHLDNRSGDRIKTECIVYSNDYGILCKSEGAEDIIALAR